MVTSDRAAMEAQLIKKAMKDSAFRQSLISNPRAAIEQSYGITLPPNVQINIYQDTNDVYNMVLPAMDSTSGSASLSGAMMSADCSGWSSAASCAAECTQCGNNDTTCAPGPTED